MPRIKIPIPDLPEEVRAQLIMRLMKFAFDKGPIWNYDRPSASLADLVSAIATGTKMRYGMAPYLTGQLNKDPELKSLIEPYAKY